MTKIIDTIISLSHTFISPFLGQVLGIKTICRFEETCSVYARRVIKQYGILYGLRLTIKRLLSCQPFIHIHG
ncbi:hypothetical protein BH09PAT1_BH09PAT1_7040 [soil metagenome]